ncbi:hypothetical protein AB0B25_16570 [Nocardia sp. NPDC049190]|uniref:hypothetical protein n=1 Tax=Nocardia sp. NPDC049190 TaxID=3155650 RepID=UPI0033D0B002
MSLVSCYPSFADFLRHCSGTLGAASSEALLQVKAKVGARRERDYALENLHAIHQEQRTCLRILDEHALRDEHFRDRAVDWHGPNARQITMRNRLLGGSSGNLTTREWAVITNCSQDTAFRDINVSIGPGALQRLGSGGRSTSYELVQP